MDFLSFGIRGGGYYKPAGAAAPGGKAIAQMGVEELSRLDPKSLTPEQLQEAARRYDQLVPQP